MDRSEASGRSTRCTSPRVPVRWAATFEDPEALGGDVPHVWCSKRQHTTCTLGFRTGARANQHQPLVHAISRLLKRMSVRHQVEGGAPFNIERDIREDIAIETGGLRDASTSLFRH